MSTAAVLPVSVSSTARIRISRDDITLRSGLVLLITLLVIAVVFPLYSLLSKSFEDMDGEFVGLQNFHEYFETPALFTSITNSLGVAISVAFIVLVLAFIYAYALTRTKMPLRGNSSSALMFSVHFFLEQNMSHLLPVIVVHMVTLILMVKHKLKFVKRPVLTLCVTYWKKKEM